MSLDSILRSLGKNLFDINTFNSTYDLGNCSIVEQTTNGFILQGNQGNIDGSNGFSNGWFRPGLRDTTMYLKAGSVVTVSADYTALEFRYTADRTETMNKIGVYLFANPTDGNVNLYNINNIVDTENKLYKVTATFTIKKDSLYFPVFTLNSNKVKIENIQIEYGTTATSYEPYQLGPKSVSISKNSAEVLKITYGSKNLFRPDYFSTSHTSSGITCQYLPDEDCFLFNGTATANDIIRDYHFWFPDVLNKPITLSSIYISGEVTVPDGKYFVVYCGMANNSTETLTNFLDCTIKQSADKTKICTKQGLRSIWFFFGSGVTATNLKVKVQLEIGSAVTDYVPYSRETVWKK